jgi:hypothetical protein
MSALLLTLIACGVVPPVPTQAPFVSVEGKDITAAVYRTRHELLLCKTKTDLDKIWAAEARWAAIPFIGPTWPPSKTTRRR